MKHIIQKTFIICSVLSIFLVASCKNEKTSDKINDKQDKETIIANVNRYEQRLAKDITQLDKETADSLVKASLDLVKYYPEAPETPDVLYRAGAVARSTGEYGKAIQLWGQIREKYANHEKAPMALFLQAFTFENDLKDKINAKSYYEMFIDKYPKSELAKQAQQLIDNINKDPEEMVKEFEEANKDEIKAASKNK